MGGETHRRNRLHQIKSKDVLNTHPSKEQETTGKRDTPKKKYTRYWRLCQAVPVLNALHTCGDMSTCCKNKEAIPKATI